MKKSCVYSVKDDKFDKLRNEVDDETLNIDLAETEVMQCCQVSHKWKASYRDTGSGGEDQRDTADRVGSSQEPTPITMNKHGIHK